MLKKVIMQHDPMLFAELLEQAAQHMPQIIQIQRIQKTFSALFSEG